MVLISKQIAYFSHVIGMLPANFIKFVKMNMCLDNILPVFLTIKIEIV